VISFLVTQRRQEIGVRVALGARSEDVLRLVLRQGASLALVGVLIGAVGALGLTRLIAGLLYGVSATDPLSFVAVMALLIVVALLASFIPARRAAKVDPMTVLRGT
jgi:ABC-type antimicrobial peptide transport system permease subunit